MRNNGSLSREVLGVPVRCRGYARRVLLLITLAAFAAQGVLLPRVAFAEDAGPRWFTLSPRIWLAQTDTPDTPTIFRETYFVPSFGAALTITPPMLEGFSVLLVGLYGVGGGNARFNPSIINSGMLLDADVERLDLEGLLIYQLPNLPVNVFIGSRYVLLEEKLKGKNATTSVSYYVDNEIAIVKAGLGASGGLTEDGNHRLFGNISAGVGFAKTNVHFPIAPGLQFRVEINETNPTLDMNVGYDYSFWNSLGLQVRYRTSLVFFDDAIGQKATDITHGPELSLSVSW